MFENLEKISRRILDTALKAVHAGTLIERDLKIEDDILIFRDDKVNLKKHNRIFIIGAGKAVVPMAEATEKILGKRITDGIIITKHHFGKPLKRIQVLEAGHPVVDKDSLNATKKLLDLTKNLEKNDLVINLVTGGGSALLEKFVKGVKLEDAQELNRLLIENGVKIKLINTIRKQISEVKNGGLAKHLAPAKVVSFILSDVISDRIDLVASGPTALGSNSAEEAIRILKNSRLWSKIPESISDYLNTRAKEEAKDSNGHISDSFPHVTNILLGSNNNALIAAKEQAEKEGFNTIIVTSQAQGEAKVVASFVSSMVNEIVDFDRPLKSPACLIIGGETTVTVTGDGVGGRNLEFVLAAAINIRHLNHNVLISSMGTDGDDGQTDVAGAMVTQYTFDQGMSIGVNPRDYLKRNDSLTFFEEVGGLLRTGPTGTNVMDIVIALVQ